MLESTDSLIQNSVRPTDFWWCYNLSKKLPGEQEYRFNAIQIDEVAILIVDN